MTWWHVLLLVWLAPPLAVAALLVRELIRGQRDGAQSSATGIALPSLKGGYDRNFANLFMLVILLAGTWLLMLGPGFGHADRTILEAVYIGHQPLLKFLARQVGHFGAPEATMILALGAGLILFLQRRYWIAPVPVIALLGGHGLAVLQRDLLGRPRPDGLIGLESLTAPSLPPTRVVDPMIAYLLIALLLATDPRYRRLAIIAALLIGGSNGLVRVLLGHHWPSDSIAGWAFGVLVALIAYRMTELLPMTKRVKRLGGSVASSAREVKVDSESDPAELAEN
jgi:undecaprenyl-diphosphatase